MMTYKDNPEDEPKEKRWRIVTAILIIPSAIAIFHSIYKIIMK